MLMGLLLMEIVAATETSLHDLVDNLQETFGPAHYARTDIPLRTPVSKAKMVQRLTNDVPDSLGGERVVQTETIDGVKYLLADDSWLLIRPSGTEPVLRVYAEARDQAMVDELLAYGESVAQG